ncbi:hypothetical protein KC19_5G080600 [Ceratodon purpureus]|uniref:L-ornithine N(5)-monooxygenase [NAD(P)H] n=1 Tax=Ceratodon purpureus TaxID=3225 RepID=A0A8T0I097_CERPU|nr:hypothetical protein KC19_5G080600 [Ceratodon purpureus]KAG0576447.1 hypothetical protein KC19_5G080600 [Ceratodon purpureus]
MGFPAIAKSEAGDGILDICVVGAGPHGLAFLTHFLSSPEHLDHFDEHPNNTTLYSHSHDQTQRHRIRCKVHDTGALRSKRSGQEIYKHFISRASTTSHRTNLKLHHGLKVLHVKNQNHIPTRVCILDRCGEAFLRKWDTHFDVLDIPFLRSTTHQHPDPLDLGLLSSFAHHTKRYQELVPLKLTGSQEDVDHGRNKAFRGPYLRPSKLLFRDFIRGLVKGFHLDGAVNCADLTKIEAVVVGDHVDGRTCISGFRITYRNGRDGSDHVVLAKRVILAVGHANLLSIPDWAVQSFGESFPKGRLLHYEELVSAMAMTERIDICRYFHSLIESEGCERSISSPLEHMRILIVGGGQTSVHLAQLAVSKLGSHPSNITFLTRSTLRSQPFDISLQWLSTTRYESMASFWTANHEHRGRMLREARGGSNAGSGASVDAECVNWLRSSGIHVKEECEVLSASWLPTPTTSGEWKLKLWDDLNCNEEDLTCDLIWLATGNAMDFRKEPVVESLQTSLQTHGLEIRTQGKLPVLNQDLSLQLVDCMGCMARPDHGVGVHVMGAYAALELGPGALNLMGARAGACRISRSIRHLIS